MQREIPRVPVSPQQSSQRLFTGRRSGGRREGVRETRLRRNVKPSARSWTRARPARVLRDSSSVTCRSSAAGRAPEGGRIRARTRFRNPQRAASRAAKNDCSLPRPLPRLSAIEEKPKKKRGLKITRKLSAERRRAQLT